MFDVISYAMGKEAGKTTVVLDGGEGYTITDPNSDGNIVIEEESEVNNG